MQRTFLNLTTVVVLAACHGGGTTAPVNVPVAESKVPRDTSPTVSASDSSSLATDNLTFTFALYGQLTSPNPPSNLIYSSYSLSILMAMLESGAAPTTAAAIAQTMDFTVDPNNLGPAFDALDLSLAQANSQNTSLNVANSIWADQSYSINQAFLAGLATNFGTGIYQQDFVHNPAGSETNINDWVSQQTSGLIPELLTPGQITSLTQVVLVNAIALDANWAVPFEVSATSNQSFYPDGGGSPSSVPLMHATLPINYATTSTYQAIELLYDDNRLAMDVVMPLGSPLSTLEATLSATSFNAITSGLSRGQVAVGLPKFTLPPTAVQVQPALVALGMGSVFAGADFSVMSPAATSVPLQVIQQATIQVDEVGTKAAAASAGIVAGAVLEPSGPTLTFDHPFFFAIRDTTTNSVLFAGRVSQP